MSCIYMSINRSPQYQAAKLLISHQRGVPAKGGLSPHLHSNTRVQKYRHICCSKLENIILSNSFPKNFYFFNVMHIYVYIQVPNIRRPMLISHQRGVLAKGGLSPHLHSNIRVQKNRHICCSKLENIILSNLFPKNFYFFNVMHIYVYIQVPNIRRPMLISHQRGVPARKAAYRHTCTATPECKSIDIYVVQNWRI